MGIIRLLVLAALIWFTWRLAKRLLQGPIAPPAPPPDNQKMVRCDWCGVHTPQSLSVRQPPHHFCSEEHRQAWLEKHDD